MCVSTVETKHMTEEATRLAKMLGNPKRLRALQVVMASSDPISPKDVCEQMPDDAALSNVAYHVRVLVEHNVLTLVGTTQVRGSTQHFYLPNPTVVDTPLVQEFLRKT